MNEEKIIDAIKVSAHVALKQIAALGQTVIDILEKNNIVTQAEFIIEYEKNLNEYEEITNEEQNG